MNTNIKSKLNLRCVHSKKTLSIVSLLFMIAIISSPLVSVFSGVSPFALGAADPDVEDVRTEANLVKEIAMAPDGKPWVIEVRTLYLEDALVIPAGKNITLVNYATSSCLYGEDNNVTILVEAGGELVLDGLRVSHAEGAKGTGVHVEVDGKFTLVSGWIFNNNVTGNGGGVYNEGDFRLADDGAIYRNSATGDGGGVYNVGNFEVTGGEIYNNKAKLGGGIYSESDDFKMTGGEIHDNTVDDDGGGVYTDGDFVMSGGKIYKNAADDNGGGVYNTGYFSLSGSGIIYNNTATTGGGVYTRSDLFTMAGGTISNNTASGNGGGVFLYSGFFEMVGSSSNPGTIANNTAKNGGGVGINNRDLLESIDINNRAVFSNNRATDGAYNRSSTDDKRYEEHIKGTRWSIDGQGYNNYDIQYTWGSRIETATPTPTPSQTASPTPTSTSTPTNRPVTPTSTLTPEDPENWWQILIVVIIALCLVIAFLVFYLPKRQAKQAEPDWIDSTPTEPTI